MSTNAISVIKPYRWEGMWVFDDARVDLLREPFIAGADTLIDVAFFQLRSGSTPQPGVAQRKRGYGIT